MISRVNYLLIIKFWIFCFFKELCLLPILVKVKSTVRNYLISVYFTFLNGYSIFMLETELRTLVTEESLNLKFCMLQLLLQQRLCLLLYKPVLVMCYSAIRLLTVQDWLRVGYLRYYTKHSIRQIIRGSMTSFNFDYFVLGTHLAIVFRRPGLLVLFLSYMVSVIKKHSMLLMFIKRFMNEFLKRYAELSGVQLMVTGKINGVNRTRRFLLRHGTLCLSSKMSTVCYALGTSLTFTGIFGIKLWFSYKMIGC